MTHCTDLIYNARVDWSEVGTPPSLHLGFLTSSGQWAVGVSSMFARLGAETVRQDVPLLADVH